MTASRTETDERLVSAAEQGDIGRVRQLLEQDADPNYKTKDGVTPLLCAASACNYALVVLLLKAHAYLDDQDSLGQTALMLAVLGPSVTVLSPSVTVLRPWVKDRKLYRTDSAQLDAEVTVQILLSYGADVRIKDVGGHTALFHAKRGGVEGLGRRAPLGSEERKKRLIALLEEAEAKLSGGVR